MDSRWSLSHKAGREWRNEVQVTEAFSLKLLAIYIV